MPTVKSVSATFLTVTLIISGCGTKLSAKAPRSLDQTLGWAALSDRGAQAEIENYISRCMKMQEFLYVPQPVQEAPVRTLEIIQEEGFGISIHTKHETSKRPMVNQAYFHKLSPPEANK